MSMHPSVSEEVRSNTYGLCMLVYASPTQTGKAICRQLRIISYHPDVSDRKGKKCPPPLQKPHGSGEDKVITGLAAELQDRHSCDREKQPDKHGPEEPASVLKKKKYQQKDKRPRQGHRHVTHSTSRTLCDCQTAI